MQLQIPITLEEFGWSSLEERARTEGLDIACVVAEACAHYTSELDNGRQATVLPKFSPPAPSGETRTLTIELEEGCIVRLEREAEREGVAVERLVGHAALLYLADTEAGRVADRADS